MRTSMGTGVMIEDFAIAVIGFFATVGLLTVLASCATNRIPPEEGLRIYCETDKPIELSHNDTEGTKEQGIAHNKTYDDNCT